MHDSLCSGFAELQNEQQELSDERQQDMQLREELRVLEAVSKVDLAFVAALYERRAYLGGCHDSAVTDRRYRTFETASSKTPIPA